MSKKELKKIIQSRNYCFTDFKNNDEFLIQMYNNNNDIIRYICWGIEICPTTKKEHRQGFIQFFNKKRFKGVQSLFEHNIHIEACKSTPNNNIDYCKKDGNFKEFGKCVFQGARSDLEQISNDIFRNKVKRSDIIQNDFQTYCRYRKGINDALECAEKINRKDFRKVEVLIYAGETGTGKTRKAMEEEDVFKTTGDNLQWFDGYDGENVLIIDEYDNNIPITKLLNLLDGYQLRLPIKGSFTYANWTKVIITTNLDKDEFHRNAKANHKAALLRRISKWITFT